MSQACVLEPHSPRQAADAEEGKKPLEADEKTILEAVKEGDATKVKRIMSPRLSIPATTDCTCAQADARTLILLRPTPLSAL